MALVPAEIAWSIILEALPSAGGTVDADRIYIPLRSGRFVALSRADGRVVWTRDIESATVPTVGGGLVYVVASRAIHALDVMTGNERWTVPFENHASLPLTLSGDQLVGLTTPATVVVVSASDGTARWRQVLSAPPRHPVVADDRRLYVALSDGSVTALSKSDGVTAWHRTFDSALSVPALARDRLIVGSADNTVYALDSARGTIAWRWRVGADVVGATANGDTVFLLALDNLVRAVDRSSGNQRWKKPLASRPAHPPQWIGGLLVITSVAPTISVYDALTGTVVGTYVAPADLEGPALIVHASELSDVALVVITRDGRVVGLHPRPPAPPVSLRSPSPNRAVPGPRRDPL